MNENTPPFFANFFRRETVTRAVKVALIVAPVLIFINHYDHIMAFKFTPVFFFKSALTFCVPYCVSSYSSARAYAEREALKK